MKIPRRRQDADVAGTADFFARGFPGLTAIVVQRPNGRAEFEVS